VVNFLIDTGAGKSILSKTDADALKIDAHSYPQCPHNSIGFGGTFRNRYLNCPVKLTFGIESTQKYTLHYDSGFNLLVTLSSIRMLEKEGLLRNTPSVLGMDILLQHFNYTSIEKK
jgi:hypothetical protein